MTRPSPLKIWITAVRPFAYPASITPVLLGVALSNWACFPVQWMYFAITLIGVVCFHTGANLLNDCYDYERGLDTEILSTSGALVRGWITKGQILTVAAIFLFIGMICGLVLVYYAGRMVLWIGIAGTLISLGYTNPVFSLKYHGMGDIAIFVAFGLLPVFGAWWVQTQSFSWAPVLWSLPISCFTVGILHANNWRDIEMDIARNCRTLASRLGDRGSSVYYRMLMVMPYILVLIYVALGIVMGAPVRFVGVLAVFIALPISLKLIRTSYERDNADFPFLDAKTAQVQMLFGLILVIVFAWL